MGGTTWTKADDGAGPMVASAAGGPGNSPQGESLAFVEAPPVGRDQVRRPGFTCASSGEVDPVAPRGPVSAAVEDAAGTAGPAPAVEGVETEGAAGAARGTNAGGTGAGPGTSAAARVRRPSPAAEG